MYRILSVSLMSIACSIGTSSVAHAQDPLPAPPGVPQLQLPQPILVAPIAPVVIRPITINEFLASFQSAPGNYEIVFVHPKTGCPVKVCFFLPPGCPKKVRYCLNELKFDYGRREVEVRFKRDGRVVVDYD